jgi:hypothetical protein
LESIGGKEMSSYDYGVYVNMHYNEKCIDEILQLAVGLSKIYLNNHYNIEHVIRIIRLESDKKSTRRKRFHIRNFEKVDINEFKETLKDSENLIGASFLSDIPSIIQFTNTKYLGKIGCHLQVLKNKLSIFVHSDHGYCIGKEALILNSADLKAHEDIKKNQEMWLTMVLSIMKIVEPVVVNCTIDPAMLIERLKKNGKDEIINNDFLPDLGEEYNWFVYLKEGIKAPEFTFEKFLEPIDFLEGKLYVNPRYILADVRQVIEKISNEYFDFYREMKAFDEAIEKVYKKIY